MARLYSGVAAGSKSRGNRDSWYITMSTACLGQIGNTVYLSNISTPETPYVPSSPLQNSAREHYPKYTLLNDEQAQAIIDYLPESWVAALHNVNGFNLLRYVYAYNHDDLVADGIEQS